MLQNSYLYTLTKLISNSQESFTKPKGKISLFDTGNILHTL